MDLPEPIYKINQQLADEYGVDTVTGCVMYRVVWSASEYERRMTQYTDTGILLLKPEIRLLPKYPWIRYMFILENYVIVPEENQEELAGRKTSYEPLWVFKDKDDKALPPTFWACKFVIDTVRAALGKKSLAKYVDEEAKNPVEAREKRVNKYMEELFGDESSLLGRTVTGEAVVVPDMEPEE